MALTHVVGVRNILADAIDTLVNAGAGSFGDIIIKAGGVTLVTIDFLATAFGVAAGGTITLAGTPLNANAAAGGTADGFEIRDKDNNEIFSGTVTGTSGGGDIELDSTSISNGQNVELTSFTYSASA